MTPRFWAAIIAVVLPAAALAQVPIQIPKALVFPNYDNVLLGKDQALEGGAYIARAGDASANFYNPAGLVQSEKSSFNASSTGWVQTKLTSEALNTSITSTKIDNVPGYLGAVIALPFVDSRNLRAGISITRLVAWAPGAIDQSVLPSTVDGLDRVTWSSAGSFTTQLYQVALAWAPVSDRSLRLGFSFGYADTSYSSSGTLSGLVTSNGLPGQFLATLRAGGSEEDLVFGGGIQWDIVAGLTVGAVVRSPGVRVSSSSLVTYESSFLSASQPATSFFRDDKGHFQYSLPLEGSFGIAYHFGDVQLEADLRFHDGVGAYDFYRSDVPLRVVSQNSDGTTTASTQPLPAFRYAARKVWNASIGGNVRVGRIATLHGGFYNSMSPVADPVTSPLRRADLYGLSGGVDFQFEHFGVSLGAGYQFGSSETVGVAVGDQLRIQGSAVKLQSISLLYAISYSF